MTPKFRILALAAMSLGAAVAAQAAIVDFEDLAVQALAAQKPLDLIPGSQQVTGFSFTNATVYHVDQVAGGMGPTDRNHKGFIQSRNAAGTLKQTISVSLAGAYEKGNIQAISYEVAANQWPVDLEVFDTVGGSRKLPATATLPSFGWTFQLTRDLTILGLGDINRIDFISRLDPFEGYSQMALDNLNFTLSGIGGGTVPEPASLALVLLALAGVGMASRRRNA